MKKLACVIAVVFAFVLSGCADEPVRRSFFAMDTYMNIAAYGNGIDEILKEAEERVKSLEKQWSVTDTDSEISKLNSSDGQPVSVSAGTAEIICFAKEMNTCTDGALDISVYPLVREWGFTTWDYHVPAQDRIDELLKTVNAQDIAVKNNTVTLKNGMMIDLGSVAKGYVSDVLAELVRKRGVTSAIFDLGGNVRTVGKKPCGELWVIGLQSPDNDSIFGTLTVGECACVTSGGYERYFNAEGKRYCHIINPATGYPAESGLISVTVIAPEGKTADALSTALFVLGADKAHDLWKQLGGFEYVAVTDKHEVLVSSGIADSFELEDDFSDWKVTVV